jgi:hypothetical protein
MTATDRETTRGPRSRVSRKTPETLPAEGEARLWSPQETAAFLGVPVATLQKWRHLRVGPHAFKVGRHVRYDPTVVRRWLLDECQLDRAARGQR